MADWWKACTEASVELAECSEAYGEIMTRLVGCMYLQSMKEVQKKKKKSTTESISVVATRSQASGRTMRDIEHKVGTAKNIILWTKQQYRY